MEKEGKGGTLRFPLPAFSFAFQMKGWMPYLTLTPTDVCVCVCVCCIIYKHTEALKNAYVNVDV